MSDPEIPADQAQIPTEEDEKEEVAVATEDGEEEQEGGKTFVLQRPWNKQKPWVRVKSSPAGPDEKTQTKLQRWLEAHNAYFDKNFLGEEVCVVNNQRFTVVVVDGLNLHTQMHTPTVAIRILGSFPTVDEAERWIAGIYEQKWLGDHEECAIIPNYVRHVLRNTSAPDQHAELRFRKTDEVTAQLEQWAKMQKHIAKHKKELRDIALRTRDPSKANRMFDLPPAARALRRSLLAEDRARMRTNTLMEMGSAGDAQEAAFLNSSLV